MAPDVVEARRLALSQVADMISGTMGKAILVATQVVVDLAEDPDPAQNFARGRLLARAFALIEETTRLARGQLIALEIVSDVEGIR